MSIVVQTNGYDIMYWLGRAAKKAYRSPHILVDCKDSLPRPLPLAGRLIPAARHMSFHYKKDQEMGGSKKRNFRNFASGDVKD